MNVSIGLRNRRLRLYERTDQGSGGLVVTAFVFTEERWARLDETTARVRAMQERLQMTLDASGEFSDDACIPLSGICKDASSNQAWWIRGFYPVPQTRCIIVGLERIADEQFVTLNLYNSASQLDGTHLVDQ